MALFDARLKGDRDFWIALLTAEGEVERSGLPVDRKRSKVWSLKRESVEIPLPAAGERELARLTGGAPFLVCTAALVALGVTLHRWTGHRTIVVGSPATVDFGVPGPEDNALPLAIDVDETRSFRELLVATRARLVEAYDHQGYALDRLVADLGVPENPDSPDAGRAPLFDVALVVEGFHRPLPPLKTDLEVVFRQDGETVRGRVDFNARLFQRETAERFAGHLANVLAGALADSSRPLESVAMLGEAEERTVLADWSAPAVEIPEGLLAHGLFERQADRTPGAVAAVFEDRSLTYAELEARANRLARRLRRAGVGPETRVGLCLERSLDMVTGLLAILKAGGAYVPLDPTYPAERLAFQLTDARMPVLLTERALRSRLPEAPETGATVLVLEDEAAAIAAESPERPNVDPSMEVSPDGLAYVLYTSGSTGRPKGVAMPHRPLVNLMLWQAGQSRLGEGGRSLQLTSLGFDVSFQEIFSTWCVGGTLVVASEAVRRDLAGLPRFLKEAGIERLFVPFVALQQLAEVASSLGEFPPSLREIVTAGEQLRVTPPVIRLFRQAEGCVLVNQYGPTEAHVVSAHALSGFPNHWPALPPIGRPVANARLAVLDPYLRPVPAGAPGELWLGGACLARGYLDRPDATAERFLPDPFSSSGDAGARLYRTGDLARHLPDGGVEYLGRLDHQVKVRGYRVEPGEIEVALGAHPGVREAVVMAREDDAGGRRLIAWVVPASAQVTQQELRGFLRDRLPEYMIPAVFVLLDRLPLTPSGKVDRRSLPAPERGRSVSASFVEPESETERRLAAIWIEVLGVERVGAHDDFFDLGGHSLLGAQVLARLNEAFALELTLRRLFETPTVAGLARIVDSLRGTDTGPAAPALVSREEARLEALLAELDGLSDEEAQALLDAEGVEPAGPEA
jgi:amino acid adenylation domain-containing protein